MYDVIGLIAITGAFVQLGMEVYRLRKEIEDLENVAKAFQVEAREERSRLIAVLAAAQSDKVQHSLGFLPDSEMQAKKRELEALKQSFQSSD